MRFKTAMSMCSRRQRFAGSTQGQIVSSTRLNLVPLDKLAVRLRRFEREDNPEPPPYGLMFDHGFLKQVITARLIEENRFQTRFLQAAETCVLIEPVRLRNNAAPRAAKTFEHRVLVPLNLREDLRHSL